MKIRLYTLPPKKVEYPFLLVNPRNHRELFRRKWNHAILDAGVEIFHKQKDYPPNFIDNYIYLAKKLTRKFKENIWVTIPDYPSDLEIVREDAIEKTLENIREIPNKFGVEHIKWIAVIQGKLNDIKSFTYCAKEIKKIGDFERIGIGTVCKSKNTKFIIKCCKIARKFFHDSWIHAFGLTLSSLNKAKLYLDSMAWTFPRESGYPSQGGKKRPYPPEEYFRRFIISYEKKAQIPIRLNKFIKKVV